MEPQVQYCTTEDGVSIAYWAIGEGPPLLYLPPMPGNIGLEWRNGAIGPETQSLATRYRLIRADGRGSGLSQRGMVGPLSPETFRLDTEAVLDRLEVPACAIWASGPTGPLAIAFAATRPERVTALILAESFAAFKELGSVPRVQAMIGLIGQDYELYTETISSVFFGFGQSEVAREYAALLRAGQTQEEAVVFGQSMLGVDSSALLPHVRCRTLVVHHRDASLVPLEIAQNLASRIPNAQLVILEGESVAGPRNDMDEAAVIDRFLLGTDAAPRSFPLSRSTSAPGTAVIVFADIAGSTELTERMGDAAFRDRARALDNQLMSVIHREGGNVIEGKLLGDGLLATFPTARQGIAAGVALAAAGDAAGLPLHVGIHAGDVIREQANVFGGAVNIAARIAGEAAPGEVLVSDVVRALGRTSAGAEFDDRGERALKGIGEPQRLWSVVRTRS
jgi:class 3 adenylate cyclase/pimeloyl-ACP methyl ester carboxylesterase